MVVVLAGQQAPGQRRPGRDGHVEGSCHRQQVAFGISLRETVFRLQAGESGPPALLGDGVGIGDDPCRGVGDPDVEDLARADRVVERAHDLLDRSEEVPRVQPVDVDVVGPQPPQALLKVPHEALALVTAAVRIVRVEGQGILRAEHELLGPLQERGCRTHPG
jgi:hypothetical protein